MTDGNLEIAVVVVNFGSHLLVERNLAAVNWGAIGYRVIVVDNFSTREERTAIRAVTERHGWTLIEAISNLGFGSAINCASQQARLMGCRAMLLVNPDAIVTAPVASALRLASLADPEAMIAPVIRDSDGAPYFHGSEVEYSTGRIRSLKALHADGADLWVSKLSSRGFSWITGACFAIQLDLFDLAGGFDEKFFLYWEDIDLSFRVDRVGGRLEIRRDLVIIHDEGGTQEVRRGRAKSSAYYYFNCRNRLLFAASNLRRSEILRWMLATPGQSWEILMRGGKRQLLHSPLPLWHALIGSAVGLGIALKSVVGGRRRHNFAKSVLVAHPSSELYGADRVMLESVEAMTAVGWDVTVTVPTDGPLIRQIEARKAHVKLSPTPVLRKSALRPAGFIRLIADAFRGLPAAIDLVRRADVVYVSTITVPAWLIMGRIMGKEVVCHVHEAESTASALLRRLMAIPPRFAHRIILNSNFSLDVLVAANPKLGLRSTIVPNGVSGPPALTAGRLSLVSPVQLLFLGRLSPRKGPQVAVAAATELIRRGVDVRLQLLGSVYEGYEWFERELRDQVRDSGLSEHVEFLGFNPDVWPDIAAADIVLIPSLVDEPFGNTAVEAMLAARPLIASNTSGLREAARGYSSAQLIEPAVVALWADAVQKVVDDWRSFRTLAMTDAQLAFERHSPTKYQQQIREVISDIRVNESLTSNGNKVGVERCL